MTTLSIHISGAAGSGKSRVVDAVLRVIREEFRSEVQSHQSGAGYEIAIVRVDLKEPK